MSTTGEIKNLYSDKDKTKVLLPRTKTKAVSDENGTGLDVLLNDINVSIKKAAPVNLLDNSYFKNPVNQRGSSTYMLGEWGGYCIDRWNTYSNGMTMTLDSNGLTLNGGFFQPISNTDMARYNNKTLTFAAKIEGVIYCCHGVYTQGVGWRLIARMDNPYGYISFENEGNDYLFAIINTSKSAVVEWAALYEGEYTLDTLPVYQPKGYAAELMECRRYFYKLRLAVKNGLLTGSKTNLRFGIPLPVIMRIENPTVTELNISGLRTTNGSNMTPTITEFTAQIYKDGWLDLLVKVEALNDATNNTPVAAYVGADISADL